MAIAQQIVTLNSSTATLVTISKAQQANYETRVSTSFQNLDGSIDIYLGNSDVTNSSYGYIIHAGASISLDLLPGDEIYAIAPAGTPRIAVLALEA
jgi:hypothetical protein